MAQPEANAPNEHLTDAPWQDAELLPPPTRWGIDDAHHPGSAEAGSVAYGFSPETRAPERWSMHFSVAHWAALTPPLAAGRYALFCRTIDRNGVSQPWPRFLQNSGRNLLHHTPLRVG